jgi:hypothetical protein
MITNEAMTSIFEGISVCMQRERRVGRTWEVHGRTFLLSSRSLELSGFHADTQITKTDMT